MARPRSALQALIMRRAASLHRQVAASLAAPPILLPYLRDLLRDCPALGSSPRRIAALLARRRIGPRSRVLDLACGKGAGAIELAARTGCRVLGVDAFAPFIEQARDHASRRNVSDLCEFLVGDVDRFALRGRPFDAAMMIGLYPFDRAAPILRRLVAPRGWYLLDDALSISAGRPLSAARSETDAFFHSLGDRVLETFIPPPSTIARANASLYRRISARAAALARREPRLRHALSSFLAAQRRAHRLLTTTLRPALWLVRRAE